MKAIIELCEQIQNDEVTMTEYQLASTIKQLLSEDTLAMSSDQPIKEKEKCPSCGEENWYYNHDEEDECLGCGYILEEKSEVPIKEKEGDITMYRCPECDCVLRPLSDHHGYCVNCMEKVYFDEGDVDSSSFIGTSETLENGGCGCIRVSCEAKDCIYHRDGGCTRGNINIAVWKYPFCEDYDNLKKEEKECQTCLNLAKEYGASVICFKDFQEEE